MAEIIFYEKPGCINNSKQKQMLTYAGHLVIARNLLTEAWSAERLETFFRSLPVAEWFNRTAPKMRDGLLDPDTLDKESALVEMIAEPLLIRRPLMIIDGSPVVGFDAQQINDRFLLGLETEKEDLESCPRGDEHKQGCEVRA